MRKALFHANTSWYLWNFRRSTIQEMVTNGVCVTVVTGDDTYFRELEIIGAVCKKVCLPLSFAQLWLLPKYVWAMYKILRNYDGVVFNFTPICNIVAGYISWLTNTKFLNNLSGLGRLKSSFLLKRLFIFLILSVVKKSEYVFVQNRDDYRWLLSQGLENKAKIIPGSGVNLKKYQFIDRQYEDHFRFIFIGRLIEQKGISAFLLCAENMRYVSNVSFAVAGDLASARKKTACKIEDLNSKGVITFHGFVKDTSTIMEKSDFLVLPTNYAEGTPKTILEAIATGMLCITSNSAGCRDVVDAGGGFYITENNAEGIESVVKDVIQISPPELRDKSLLARSIAENSYCESLCIDAYVDILTKVDGLR